MPTIVDAAIELGLETVTLAQIARHLGVAQATLYRHVHNRDELMRLAAFQLLLQRRPATGNGEHWAAIAERYAESLFETLVAAPQVVTELHKGRLGPHLEIDILEEFLEAMQGQGFSLEDAAALFHSIGLLAVGAASGAIGLSASTRSGQSWAQAMRATLGERDRRELPLTREIVRRVPEDSLRVDWRRSLRALLAGVAAQRGEALPEIASDFTRAAAR
ncbi:TetR family transcriptional regulator [Solimonas marina]|uniref:TetR family transcriptional regulator n=1 Tax=Solimonas marina TaxID=2714601 RepID=A0A969W7U9_9GAMM|nr:TetR family transcriptional regulator [Solimonas marina]